MRNVPEGWILAYVIIPAWSFTDASPLSSYKKDQETSESFQYRWPQLGNQSQYLDYLVLNMNNSLEIVIISHFRLNNSVSMLQHLFCEMSEIQSIPILPPFWNFRICINAPWDAIMHPHHRNLTPRTHKFYPQHQHLYKTNVNLYCDSSSL